jgi:hypothetical protein
MTPREALKDILTLVTATDALKTDGLRKVLLRSIIVIAQKGLGVAPDGATELAPNVLPFPCTDSTKLH